MKRQTSESGIITLIGLVIQDYIREEVILFWQGSVLTHRAFWWWRDGMAMPRIVSILARDSTLYFFV
ncbi:hypothetical protein D9619_006100 [Psilocybe cf. subviscida]|uniref:Uncharacterized protein n=1 Tax=Psilocybe cf. subviscida TaxID=2480587 RepID=A0A8H5B4P6_9AGAR|nr:hypothetical protein D9619_006100 [Psilocybe cf. subviscida]